MDDDRDLLLSFRAKTDRWADRARAEAKAVRLAVAEEPDGVTVAVHRLRLIVQHIRTASDGALDAIATLRKKHSVTPDEADELQAVIDEITALDDEMSGLLLATNAILRTNMKRGRLGSRARR
jgi:DNA integrity scanning protein DisA with diadenylate cyclase activity